MAEPKPITTLDVTPAPPKKEGERGEYLIVLTGGQMGQIFSVRGDEATIGRGADCEIRIDDDGVSRRHAKLLRADGALFIEDLGSRNGTCIGGQLIGGPEKLKDGDRIQLGLSTTVKYTLADRMEAAYQRRMFEAAVKDGLTRIYNRRHFYERLDAEMAFSRRHSTPLALLMVDVDSFGRINDSFGHLVGDKVLKNLSRRVGTIVRTEDVFARYGGSKFAILSRVDGPGALALAERLRERVAEKPFAIEGSEIAVTVSIGVAAIPEVVVDGLIAFLTIADGVLGQAKKSGRNRVEWASEAQGSAPKVPEDEPKTPF